MSTACKFSVEYQCPKCDATFRGSNAKGDMYYHIAWMHPVHKVYLSDDKIIECEFCGAHVHESDYTGHILARHPEEQ